MIQVDNLRKVYGSITAVDQLSFHVSPGEVLGLLGPNGAGKSTSMKMIAGFVTPTSGRAQIFGHDVCDNARAAKSQLGYLPEGAPGYADMQVGAFLHFVAQARGLGRRDSHKAVGQALERLDLTSVVARRMETLSKGFRRRVGLAQAILHNPPALILDEPTDGLDPNQKHQVRELIRELAHDKLIIVSTHILEEVGAICTRAAIIAAGRLITDETPDALSARSRYHGSVFIQLVQPSADAELHFSKLPEVAEYERDAQNLGQFTLFPKPSHDLFSAVRRLSEEKSLALKQCYVQQGRLDDVFRRLTAIQEAA